MCMKIFNDETVAKEDLDYTKWETFNGDYVNIADVGSTYIERCLDMLELYMERYPNHTNYEIWKNYIKVFEHELLVRDDLLFA